MELLGLPERAEKEGLSGTSQQPKPLPSPQADVQEPKNADRPAEVPAADNMQPPDVAHPLLDALRRLMRPEAGAEKK